MDHKEVKREDISLVIYQLQVRHTNRAIRKTQLLRTKVRCVITFEFQDNERRFTGDYQCRLGLYFQPL